MMQTGTEHTYSDSADSESYDGSDHRRRLLEENGLKKVVIPESEYKIIEKCRRMEDSDICMTYYYTDQSIAVDVYALGAKVISKKMKKADSKYSETAIWEWNGDSEQCNGGLLS